MEQGNHEKTPKRISINGLSTRKTPISTPKNFTSRFLLLSNNQNCTPSPNSLKNRVVRNPFENQLHEKLRLPVISSPSLFQPPTTPKQENKLEMFEWTIEELSNLNPVNVIPHETQFREEEDPQFEEKAQAAISSFFQEQQIVPSPHVCNLRKHKIQLSEDFHSTQIYNSTALPSNSAMISNHSPFGSIPKIKRDMTTQTALSFPPNLPREIEDLLKKYQINDEDENDENELPSNDRSMMDISTLRRKLFIQRPETPENDFILDDAFAVNLSPAPKTPELTRRTDSFVSSQNNNGDAFDAINGDMFGELSPIRNEFSNNCSPAMSSNDISMTSDAGRDFTPSSRRCSKLKKKKLSESFSLLQNELNDDSDDKENFVNEFPVPNKDRRLFGRFDSGFENGDSNNYSFSAEFMQI
ncbi:protein aurora borealis [Chironomus tepperi]|uniref:protein aurora borealis n=1 Tax=Chironomus tepperi TaxID=113505 RepID=UPI00391FACE7